jgi:hypothetical protein
VFDFHVFLSILIRQKMFVVVTYIICHDARRRTGDQPLSKVESLMSDELVTIATFATTPDAGPAQGTLEANGIRAFVQGGTTADMLSYYGTAIGGVKLQVAVDDVERALACLGLAAEENDATPIEPWDCAQCGTHVDAGFEVCWSCGASIDGTPEVDAAESSGDEEPAESAPLTERCPMCGNRVSDGAIDCPACGELLNDAPVDTSVEESAEFEVEWPVEEGAASVEETPEHLREMEEKLTSAFRAAILGIAICPPFLSIYSVIQLTEYRRLRDEYGADDNWRSRVTTIVNWTVILSVAMSVLFAVFGDEFSVIIDWLPAP